MQLPILATTEPWYARGLRFACTQCGNCCTGGPGYVWLTRREVERLAAHLGLPVVRTIQRYCRNVSGRLSLREVERNGLHDCIFLQTVEVTQPAGEGRPARTVARRMCAVYAVRPLQCRTWPFWEGNLLSRENWERAGQRCPGIGQGPKYTPSRIEALRDAEDWPAEKRP
jgi:Fe-S-cluster containining protein